MPKLLQIDTCLALRSTGRITESIAKIAISNGWECHIIHGARTIGDTIQHHYQATTKTGTYIHFIESFLWDKHGLGSRRDTKKIVKIIENIKPDVINLHCIHGYYINYKILFDYLKKTSIPIVWTFHDCWAFTGHCAYFDKVRCEKWKIGCDKPCPAKKDYPKSLFFDNCKRNFELKKKLFLSIEKRLTIVPVSFWLEGFVRQSFFKNCSIQTIHNGINIDVFSPQDDSILREHLGLKDRIVVLGVAMPWSPRKGLPDMLCLATKLPSEYSIILIGLDEKQMQDLPSNVIGVGRTNDAKELARYYSLASVFLNPTYEDNFPTTNIEALACGTPVVTYSTGGSPEAIDSFTGSVVVQGDVEGLYKAVLDISNKVATTDIRKKCRERAEIYYNSMTAFLEYLELYNRVIE